MIVKPRLCHYCGLTVPEAQVQQFSARFCSTGCEVAHNKDGEDIANKLIELGFIQSSEAPNIYSKDGIALTIEEVMNEGMDTALASHKAVSSGTQRPVR